MTFPPEKVDGSKADSVVLAEVAPLRAFHHLKVPWEFSSCNQGSKGPMHSQSVPGFRDRPLWIGSPWPLRDPPLSKASLRMKT